MALSPEQVNNISIGAYNIEDIEAEVDESIMKYHGEYSFEEALLDKEYPLSVRNEIGKRYMENGWKYVYHQTSSENGERPGLTCFVFSEVPVEHLENNARYIRVHMLNQSKIDTIN